MAVDLDGVDVLDDTGLGVLLGAAGRARQAGGELVVVVSDERLRARFEATGFDRAVAVVDRLAAVPHALTSRASGRPPAVRPRCARRSPAPRISA